MNEFKEKFHVESKEVITKIIYDETSKIGRIEFLQSIFEYISKFSENVADEIIIVIDNKSVTIEKNSNNDFSNGVLSFIWNGVLSEFAEQCFFERFIRESIGNIPKKNILEIKSDEEYIKTLKDMISWFVQYKKFQDGLFNVQAHTINIVIETLKSCGITHEEISEIDPYTLDDSSEKEKILYSIQLMLQAIETRSGISNKDRTYLTYWMKRM